MIDDWLIEDNVHMAQQSYDMAQAMTRMCMLDASKEDGRDKTAELAVMIGAILEKENLHTACGAIARVLVGMSTTAERKASVDPRVTINCVATMAMVLAEQVRKTQGH